MKRIVFIFALLASIASLSSCLPLYNNNGGDTSGAPADTTSALITTSEPTTVPPVDVNATTPASTAATSSTVVSPYAPYLDEAQTHKPTYEEVLSITREMPATEVIERLGKPHKLFGSGMMNAMVWYTAEGHYVFISFNLPLNMSDNVTEIEKLMKYSTVRGVRIDNGTASE